MKITFVLPSMSLTGGNRVIAIYAEHLQKRGHEVFCVALPQKVPRRRDQLKSLLRGNGLIAHPKPELSYFDEISTTYHVIDRIRPIVDTDVPNADVVIATWWETSLWVFNMSAEKGTKVYFMQDYGAPGQELEKIVPTWSLPLYIITISSWLVDLIYQHCPTALVSLVPNSVDRNLFYAEPRTKQSQATVGFVYSPMVTKGADIAFEAIQLAKYQLPDLQAKIFGVAQKPSAKVMPPYATYERKVSDSRIRKIYNLCDTWLFPSRIEGFGLPILEAMACGTPVISTPAGAAPELLADGGGILVNHDDPSAMAAAIVKICNLSDEEWRAMSDIAYSKVQNYSWEDATDKFEAALRRAIELNSAN